MPEGSSAFDKPVYSGELFQAPKPNPLDQIRPYFGKIIAAIILIVIVYFVYWFFIGSFQQVTISVSGIDGLALTSVSGSISQDGRQIASITGKSKTLSLKPGNYEVSIESPDFKPLNDSIEVSPENTDFSMSLEADIDVVPTSIRLAVGSGNKIFAGDNGNEATLFLSNNGPSAMQAEVLASADAKEITASIQPSTIIVGANSQDNAARVIINVSPTINVTDRINGDSHKITFRVKGTNNKITQEFNVLPKLKITLSPTRLAFGDIKANDTPYNKQITLQNSERAEISGTVEFEAINIQSTENSAETVKGWFSFSPNIVSVKSGSTTEQVYVKVPKTAKSETITGELRASGDSWNSTITFTMKIIGAKTTISKPTLSRTSITLSKGDLSRTALLSIKNDSDFALINAKIKLDTECKDKYIIPDSTSLPEIQIGAKNDVLLKLRVPADATIGNPQNCSVCVTFDDPLNPGEIIDTLETTGCPQILITPSE